VEQPQDSGTSLAVGFTRVPGNSALVITDGSSSSGPVGMDV
jgi:hypothetical protein